MINVIIGKDSPLTQELSRHIKNLIVLSGRDKNLLLKLNKLNKFNVIFNNFYPSKFLNKLDFNYTEFYQNSLIINANILDCIDPKKINKIIYSSSSSIYGSFNDSSVLDESINKRIYSSIKSANENLFISFCVKNKIQYIIARLFNLYGSDYDNFSIISKLISAFHSNKEIIIYNKGRAIRDFIHIKDVANIFNILINKCQSSEILDIGTGYGIKIDDILNCIGKNNFRLLFSEKFSEETQYSIANIDKLESIISNYKFIKLDSFLKSKLQIKKNFFFNRVNNYSKKFYKNSEEKIIYGAGNAGIQAYKQLVNNNIKVLYFVDDNPKLQNRDLFGVPIISYSILKSLSKKNKINSILVAIPSLSKNKIGKLVNKLKLFCSNIETLPNKKRLISDIINLSDITSVEINNILNRKEIFFKKNNFNYLNNKNILITGAGGSIGSELCRQLSSLKIGKIIALDNSEVAIYNLKRNTLNFK